MKLPGTTRHQKLYAAMSVSLLALAGCGSDSSLPQLSEAVPASFTGDCSTVAASLTALKGTVITSSSTVAAGVLSNINTPEHCLVTGKMNERVSAVDGATYYIGFQMRLPKSWNGRFFYQANGGTDGAVSNAVGALGGGPVTSALVKGFAVLSSDAGHQSQTTPFFGIDPQARIDYGYNAVAQLTPMAKDLIKSVYGKAPDRSYLGGCSNGGRHALVAASRYGDQYDGILGGSPGYNLPKAAVAQLWGVQQYATVATATLATDKTASGTVVTLPKPLPDVSTAFTATERAMIASKIVDKCDALDGVVDNWVGDVPACQKAFNVSTDIPTCSGDRDGSCLTSAQKTVLTNVHAGAKNSAGASLYSSFPYDAGISSAGWATWKYANSTGVGRDPGATAFIFTTPPQTDTINFLGLPYAMSFNVDTEAPKIFATSGLYTESAMSFMAPLPPSNLSKLYDRGAKMIVYHGTADPVFSFNDTVSWFDSVKAVFSSNTDRFVKLYPVPGMGHCSGGPAADQFDMIEPLVNWVEKGVAPSTVVAAARGTGTSTIPALINAEVPASWAPNRTRPLCPYPTVATYNGSGDMNLAASFNCK
jgi:pimeloyl-ACP methyl ester carboxylesterase